MWAEGVYVGVSVSSCTCRGHQFCPLCVFWDWTQVSGLAKALLPTKPSHRPWGGVRDGRLIKWFVAHCSQGGCAPLKACQPLGGPVRANCVIKCKNKRQCEGKLRVVCLSVWIFSSRLAEFHSIGPTIGTSQERHQEVRAEWEPCQAHTCPPELWTCGVNVEWHRVEGNAWSYFQTCIT